MPAPGSVDAGGGTQRDGAIADPASVNAGAGTLLIESTTLAGAGFIPNPLPAAEPFPVTDTRTMTSIASTTNTVPNTAAVMAVERFWAHLADPRRDPGPPVLAR